LWYTIIRPWLADEWCSGQVMHLHEVTSGG
jgi:hypothetical protein